MGELFHHTCTLQWRHNRRDSVSNHQPYHCLLKRLFRRRSKKTSKLRVTGLCAGNSPVTGEFPAQIASNTENVSILWRHHDFAGKRSCYNWYQFIVRKDVSCSKSVMTNCIVLTVDKYALLKYPIVLYIECQSSNQAKVRYLLYATTPFVFIMASAQRRGAYACFLSMSEQDLSDKRRYVWNVLSY